MDPHTPQPRKSIISNELAWHEQEAHRRFTLDAFLYDPPVFDRLVDSGIAFLQASPGDTVFDIGCGEGKETLLLAQQGLLVVATDLSHQQICRARELVAQAGLAGQVFFIQANAEELPFAPETCGSLYGKAILHHLDIDLSAQELRRVLAPGGRATFAEPMAHHPLFWLGRHLTPQLRTKDEHPLSFGELRRFAAYFGQWQVEEYFFLAPLAYVLRSMPGGEGLFRRVHAILQRADSRLLRMLPFLKDAAWYGLVKLTK